MHVWSPLRFRPRPPTSSRSTFSSQNRPKEALKCFDMAADIFVYLDCEKRYVLF